MQWIVPYEGTDWVFEDGRVTAHEARLMKQVTGGMTPLEITDKRLHMDPDVWMAMLVVARERSGMKTAEALQVDDHLVDLDACLDATNAATDARRAESKAAAEEAKPNRRARRAKVADESESEPAAPAA